MQAVAAKGAVTGSSVLSDGRGALTLRVGRAEHYFIKVTWSPQWLP